MTVLARRHVLAVLGTVAGLGVAMPLGQTASPSVRLCILEFGSVSWTIDVVRRHRLDEAERVTFDVVELAFL